MGHEYTLIAFTLVSQLIAGATILYAVLHFVRSKQLSRLPSGFHVNTPELLLMTGLLIAIFISFFHLGAPQRAGNALNNLKSSWISREILSLSVFFLGILLLFLGRWLRSTREGLLSFLYVFSLVSAIVLIIAMIQLYMIPVVVTWSTWYTPFSFTITSLTLGVCAVLAYLIIFQIRCDTLKALIHILSMLLLADVLVSGLHQYGLSHLSLMHQNPILKDNLHLYVTLLRISVILVALVLLVVYARKSKARAGRPASNFLPGIAMLLVLLEQLAGRWLFFASYVKLGI